MKISRVSIILIASFFALEALARVGGGGSYSGGHSSGGGGGGSYGGGGYSSGGGAGGFWVFELIQLVLRLVFTYPLLGIPVLFVTIAFVYLNYLSPSARKEQTYGGQASNESREVSTQFGQLFQNAGTSQAIENLRQKDPNFSRALFMDFVYSLYAQIHNARGQGHLSDYSNYFSANVIAGLKTTAGGLKSVDGIVIGSARITQVKLAATQVQIEIEFQANYTEVSTQGASQSWFAVERWILIRDPAVLSRTPETTRVLRCPSCGAPLSETRNGRCNSCGNQNDHGQFDWLVQFRSESREKREPLLTTTVPEEGTDLPSLIDPDFNSENANLMSKRPDFSWTEFDQRIRYSFLELQKAWTERRWELARPFESDALFQMHYYWISAYQRQQLVNVLKDVKIQKVVPVKISQDAFYSSITVRIYASMIDYTESATDHRLVCGSKSRPREFSEYWTFIRSHQPAKPGVKASNEQCPSCGAPLKINMAGVCEFCKTKVTSGNFSWVLSEIEQDEAYAG